MTGRKYFKGLIEDYKKRGGCFDIWCGKEGIGSRECKSREPMTEDEVVKIKNSAVCNEGVFACRILLPIGSNDRYTSEEIVNVCISKSDVVRKFIEQYDELREAGLSPKDTSETVYKVAELDNTNLPAEDIFKVSSKIAELPNVVEFYKGKFTGQFPECYDGDAYRHRWSFQVFDSSFPNKQPVGDVSAFKIESDYNQVYCLFDRRNGTMITKSEYGHYFANQWEYLFFPTVGDELCEELRREVGEKCILLYDKRWYIIIRRPDCDYLIYIKENSQSQVIYSLYKFFNIEVSERLYKSMGEHRKKLKELTYM